MSPTGRRTACNSCSGNSRDAARMNALRPASSWRRLPPCRFAGCCVLLVLALLLAGCSGEVLYSNLDQQQANEVVAALMRGGIEADKQAVVTNGNETWQVRVDKQDLPRATDILTSQGLPRKKLDTFCDVFKAGGFVSSNIEDKGRFRCALDQSIASTLRNMDGVVDASVEVASPDKNVLTGSQDAASAAVVIVARPDSPVLQQAASIQALVKNAVTGIPDTDHVTVQFSVRQPAEASARTAEGRVVTGMRSSDLGPGLLITLAVLAVLAALLLLWRSRASLQKIVANRGLPGPGFRKNHEP